MRTLLAYAISICFFLGIASSSLFGQETKSLSNQSKTTTPTIKQQKKENKVQYAPVQTHTSQRKVQQTSTSLTPDHRISNSKLSGSEINRSNYSTKQELQKAIAKVNEKIELYRQSNLEDKEMTIAKLNKSLEYLRIQLQHLIPKD